MSREKPWAASSSLAHFNLPLAQDAVAKKLAAIKPGKPLEEQATLEAPVEGPWHLLDPVELRKSSGPGWQIGRVCCCLASGSEKMSGALLGLVSLTFTRHN